MQTEKGSIRPKKAFLRSASWSVRSGLPPLSVARPSIAHWPPAGPVGAPDLCSKICEHVYLGGTGDGDALQRFRITHVLNCAGAACPEYLRPGIVHRTLWLQDSPTEDISSVLYNVFDYLEEVRAGGGRVLVHCRRGISRSAALVIAYIMWRHGQCFEEAFRAVKAARGVANPNLGFAAQLMQFQKRFQPAAADSPVAAVRMYRMAPHSANDPLHLVPKRVLRPARAALDSRGAFLLVVNSAIFVWIGEKCHPVMSRSASCAAAQVVRYERLQETAAWTEEGREPLEYWAALGFGSHETARAGGSGSERGAGMRYVEAYDGDFELFESAVRGAIVSSQWKTESGIAKEDSSPVSYSPEGFFPSGSATSSPLKSPAAVISCDQTEQNPPSLVLPSSVGGQSQNSRGMVRMWSFSGPYLEGRAMGNPCEFQSEELHQNCRGHTEMDSEMLGAEQETPGREVEIKCL